jgi:hypothetical protein
MKKLILLTLGLIAFACIMPTFAKEVTKEVAKGKVKIINNTGKSITLDFEYYKKRKEPYAESNLLAKGNSHEYAYKNDEGWPLMKISGEKFKTIFSGKEIKEKGTYTISE